MTELYKTTTQPELKVQDLNTLDVSKLTPLSPEVISRQVRSEPQMAVPGQYECKEGVC